MFPKIILLTKCYIIVIRSFGASLRRRPRRPPKSSYPHAGPEGTFFSFLPVYGCTVLKINAFENSVKNGRFERAKTGQLFFRCTDRFTDLFFVVQLKYVVSKTLTSSLTTHRRFGYRRDVSSNQAISNQARGDGELLPVTVKLGPVRWGKSR